MMPVLCHVGPFPIYSYGTLMALGLLAGLWMARRQARDVSVDPDHVTDTALWALAGGIAGARLLYVIINWEYFQDHPTSIPKLWEGGLVFYGGLAGGVAAATWHVWRQVLPLGIMVDLLAPGLALAQAVGRLGCFMNGCCYGRVTPYGGVVFPSLHDGLPRLPTQLLEAIFLVGMAVFLRRRWARRTSPGELGWWYAGLYASGRFAIEFLREDDRGPLWGGLSVSQWVSVVILGLVAAAAWRRSRRS